jgi:RNA 3'-terminal phosphate cyclase (ATP)
MGAEVEATLCRHGFHPAGGGEIRLSIRPSRLRPLELLERGPILAISTWARVASLPLGIAEREVAVARKKLGIPPERGRAEAVPNGPGNVITIDVESAAGTEVFTEFGRIGLPAEKVASNAVREAKAFLRHEVPVGPHLADQLLLPLALAGGGAFRTVRPTTHATTNAAVIEAFLPVRIRFDELGEGRWECRVGPA